MPQAIGRGVAAPNDPTNGAASAPALHARAAVAAADLEGETLIMAKTACSAQILARAGVDVARARPMMRYHTSDSATILAMVREGLGISVLPRMMLPGSLEGAVALPLAPRRRMAIGLALRAEELASPLARRFIASAEAWVQANGAAVGADARAERTGGRGTGDHMRRRRTAPAGRAHRRAARVATTGISCTARCRVR
jgi:hypothetical protein